MDTVQDQYEAYPYPARDPADEARRLIEGSPSHPLEVDHYLFEGKCDWSTPMRVLFAGGGTGDGLIMFAAYCQAAGVPVEIVYLDLSEASLDIAQARAEARDLSNISFHQDSLLNAPDYGVFDYIDSCGVLHHLPEPLAGFRALRAALKDTGGFGGMVYAPHGRSGVYPLQAAFRSLFAEVPTKDALPLARQIVDRLPATHAFARNEAVSDHKTGDAGFVDLLLHSQDRAYSIAELVDVLDQSDFKITSLIEPLLYRPEIYLPKDEVITYRLAALSDAEKWALAENLHGGMKLHIFYAVPKARNVKLPSASDMKLVPHLRTGNGAALAKQIAAKGAVKLTLSGASLPVRLPKQIAPVIASIDGRKSLSDIALECRIPLLDLVGLWRPVHEQLTATNVLNYAAGFKAVMLQTGSV